ncbi:MAG: hypothetical protein AAB927_03080 [Patescibacteria group bacterium]
MHTHPTRTLFILLAIIVLLIGFAYALFVFMGGTFSRTAPANDLTAFPADAPAPTPQDYVAEQKGFQYLVSYTSNGFNPSTLSVKKDETVRFTNNSDNPLRLALESAQVASLNRGEYYEAEFNK